MTGKVGVVLSLIPAVIIVINGIVLTVENAD